jgi:periplasmic protein TonB
MTEFRKKNRITSTLDDIVFENRNKGYGSYHLRSTYKRRLKLSFLLVLGVFLLTILVIFLWDINPLNDRYKISDSVYTGSVVYNPELIPVIIQLPGVHEANQIRLAEPAEPSSKPERATKNTQRGKVEEVKHQPVLPLIDTSQAKIIAELLLKHQQNVLKAATDQPDSLIIILDEAPEFPGGYTAVQAYFFKNQHYPEAALLSGVRGNTIVSFIINEQGFVEDARVVSGIDPQLDMEAIRLVKMMPQWKPGYYKGKPIACMLVMPVNFAIR